MELEHEIYLFRLGDFKVFAKGKVLLLKRITFTYLSAFIKTRNYYYFLLLFNKPFIRLLLQVLTTFLFIKVYFKSSLAFDFQENLALIEDSRYTFMKVIKISSMIISTTWVYQYIERIRNMPFRVELNCAECCLSVKYLFRKSINTEINSVFISSSQKNQVIDERFTVASYFDYAIQVNDRIIELGESECLVEKSLDDYFHKLNRLRNDERIKTDLFVNLVRIYSENKIIFDKCMNHNLPKFSIRFRINCRRQLSNYEHVFREIQSEVKLRLVKWRKKYHHITM